MSREPPDREQFGVSPIDSNNPELPEHLNGPLRLFRLHYPFYAAALIAASVAAFGQIGWAIGTVVVVFWTAVFVEIRSLSRWILFLVVILIGISVLLPALQQVREYSRRTACKNNLKQIGLALHNYHDDHGSFPPAVTRDAEGRAMHSWRVLLLPYIDQFPLYREYDLTEPWDSEKNRLLIEKMPICYVCPSQASDERRRAGRASYFAIVGEKTAWIEDRARSLKDFADSMALIAMVVESNSESIIWTEPRDLTHIDSVRSLSAPLAETSLGHAYSTYFYEYDVGRHLMFADGSVSFAAYGLDAEIASSLVLLNDGEPLDNSGISTDGNLVKRIPRWNNWISLGLFLILAFLPAPWAWRRWQSGNAPEFPARYSER